MLRPVGGGGWGVRQSSTPPVRGRVAAGHPSQYIGSEMERLLVAVGWRALTRLPELPRQGIRFVGNDKPIVLGAYQDQHLSRPNGTRR